MTSLKKVLAAHTVAFSHYLSPLLTFISSKLQKHILFIYLSHVLQRRLGSYLVSEVTCSLALANHYDSNPFASNQFRNGQVPAILDNQI